MALTFPSTPTNGQVYLDTITGNRYIYNSNTGAWAFSSNNVGMSISSTPPGNIGPGSMWYNREIGRTFVYYNDGDSSQWVETVPAGSIDTSTIASYVTPIYISLNTNWSITNTAYTFANVAINTANTAFPNTPNVSFNGSFNVPNGAVSIGTNAFPTGKFQVSTANGEISRFTATGASGGYHVSFFDNSTPWYFGSAKATIAGNINDLYFGSGAGTTNNLIFGTAGTERVRIDATGNVTVPNVVAAGNIVANRANVDIIFPRTTGGRIYVPGHVVQIQSTTKTDSWTASIAAQTWTDIPGMSVSITPVYSTSRILVSGFLYGSGQSTVSQFYFRLVRDSTPIGIGDAVSNRPRVTGRCYLADTNVIPAGMPFQHYDSPGTTSSVTYKIQATTETSTYSLYVNRTQNDTDGHNGARTISNITVMEIAQ